jgi:alpha-ribazole phosphatase
MTRVYLLRHGEVAVEYHRTFGGRIDMDLSPRGREQAKALAGYLRRVKFDAIYASPMKRAQQTLAPLAAEFRALTPVTLADLREVDFGEWTGHTWEQVQEKFGAHAFDWLEKMDQAAIPGGESAAHFRARVEPCLKKILAAHPGQTTAVVCHGGVIRMLLSLLLGMPFTLTARFEIEYASATVIDLGPLRTEVQLMNFTPWRDLE